MKHQRGFAYINDTCLYYETAGSGQPLVFIHGFSLDRRMWDDQWAVFARHYQVIRYDLRGFGQSAVPDGRTYRHADDLKGLLDHLNIAQAHLVGLSLGGWVALNFALAYPQAVKSLVLADAVLVGLEWSEEYLAAINPIWVAAREQGSQAAKDCWLASPLLTPAMGQVQVASRLRQIITEYSGWHFVNDEPGQAMSDVRERLASITAPTFVLIGEQDMPDFHQIADELQQIPQARQVVVAGAGHMANMEAPESFNEYVLAFLSHLLR